MTRAEVDALRMEVETGKFQARAMRREAADSDLWEWLSRERARLLRRWAGRLRRVHQVRVGQFGARHHVIVNGERVRVRFLSA